MDTASHHEFQRAAAWKGEQALIVELDGALMRSSLRWEAAVALLRSRFMQWLMLLCWRLRGREHFDRRLAAALDPDVAALPFDHELLAYLGAEHAGGRRLILACHSMPAWSNAVARHLKIFDRVLSMPHDQPAYLDQLYGAQGFDYLGSAATDKAIWPLSRHAYAAGQAHNIGDGRSTQVLGAARAGWIYGLFKAMRPRQWLKNLLVFLPMLAGHALTLDAFGLSLLAFAAFCLCASSAYLLNDTLDVQNDRAHPTKYKRPVASGVLPIPVALLASALLVPLAFALAAAGGPALLLVVAIYFVSTVAYSLHLKQLLMVDIVTLAILYSLRILGGSASTGIEPSFWMLTFSFFLFLSLALLKRHGELINLQMQGKKKTSGRGYTVDDKAPISMMGVNTAFMSVLIFVLYFNSENVARLYRTPALLFAIVPLLVFWLGRLWTLSFRGEIKEDPLLYVSRDPVSLVVLAACLALGAAASF